MLGVKIIMGQSGEIKVKTVKLKGPTIKDFSYGKSGFSGVKFSTTSFNNDVKFSLNHYLILIKGTKILHCIKYQTGR